MEVEVTFVVVVSFGVMMDDAGEEDEDGFAGISAAVEADSG